MLDDQLASIAAQAGVILKERGQTVAVADGSTGGLISAGLLTVPGATAFYIGGGVIYSLKGRSILLDLSDAELNGMRPVTESYALLQARGIRDRFASDWGVAESGSAGPGKHPLGIKAGLSCVAVVGPGAAIASSVETNSDDRIENMKTFALAALNLLTDTLRQVNQTGGR
jgi:nicotinamide-nucleotide amidase